MKRNIFLVSIIAGFIVLFNNCSKVPDLPAPDVTLKAFALNPDLAVVNTSSIEITIQMQEVLKLIQNESTNWQVVQVLSYKGYARFQFTGKANVTSIWTGDKGHDYDAFLNGETDKNKGSVLTKDGILNYVYTEPGTYKVYLVATNWSEENADDYKREIKTITVKVVK